MTISISGSTSKLPDLYIHAPLRHAFLYNFNHVHVFRHSVTAYVEHARESKSCRNGFSGFEYSVEKNSAQIPTAASTNFSRDHFRARILAPLRAQLQSPTTCNWSRKLRKNPHCRGTPDGGGRMCEECYFLFINPRLSGEKKKRGYSNIRDVVHDAIRKLRFNVRTTVPNQNLWNHVVRASKHLQTFYLRKIVIK